MSEQKKRLADDLDDLFEDPTAEELLERIRSSKTSREAIDHAEEYRKRYGGKSKNG